MKIISRKIFLRGTVNTTVSSLSKSQESTQNLSGAGAITILIPSLK